MTLSVATKVIGGGAALALAVGFITAYLAFVQIDSPWQSISGSLLTLAGVLVAGAAVTATFDTHEAARRDERLRRIDDTARENEREMEARARIAEDETRRRIEDAMVDSLGVGWRDHLTSVLHSGGAGPVSEALQTARVHPHQIRIVDAKLFDKYDQKRSAEHRAASRKADLTRWEFTDPEGYREYARMRFEHYHDSLDEIEDARNEAHGELIDEEHAFNDRMRHNHGIAASAAKARTQPSSES